MFRKIAVVAGLMAAAIAGPALAQDYPEKPIEFIVRGVRVAAVIR